MAIIGPMAISQANLSHDIIVDPNLTEVKVTTNGKQALNKLINTYAELFGHISVEVSREAVGKALKKNNIQEDISNIIE